MKPWRRLGNVSEKPSRAEERGKIVKILITGGRGMLARALLDSLAGHDLSNPGTEDLDVESPGQLRAILESRRPELIFHCAAWTDVDACESDPDRAFRVNAWGTRNVAAVAAHLDIEMVYFSTDYVFDGEAGVPYREYDPRAPLSVYGRTKSFGEDAVREVCPRHFIVRTSGLFGLGGASFPKSILEQLERKRDLEVVSDQTLAPTSAQHLAEGLTRLLGSRLYGTYHLTSSGQTDWFGYARKILEILGESASRVRPITSEEAQRPARRPAFSVLDTGNFRSTFSWTPPSWEEGLRDFLRTRP
jgi:dTDP-4-dehydrorhamnose reductase